MCSHDRVNSVLYFILPVTNITEHHARDREYYLNSLVSMDKEIAPRSCSLPVVMRIRAPSVQDSENHALQRSLPLLQLFLWHFIH